MARYVILVPASFSSRLKTPDSPSNKAMKSPILSVAFVVTCLCISASAQLTNETIQSRIRSARSEKNITLTYDAAGGNSKLMAVSENFSRDEAGESGLLAMNFALGIIYGGDALTTSPESFILTFWVMAKKPRFSSNHTMTVALSDEMLVIGSARYAAKPREQMEYLNFEITRENLAKIAGATDVRFMLGDSRFTFTKSQMKLIADIVAITDLR